MEIVYHELEQIMYSTDKRLWCNVPPRYMAQYLKGIFKNEKRFISRFVNWYETTFKMLGQKSGILALNQLVEYFKLVEPFTYNDIFTLEDEAFRAIAFSSIDIAEMMKNLNANRVAVDGKTVTHRNYSINGSYELKTYDIIYEVWQADVSIIGGEGFGYAVKCWCTTTDKEHFLWIDEKYKDDPFAAVASLCMIYENMLPHITSIKRQGDIFLFEMDSHVEPAGEIISLNKEQYYRLLVAQT